MLTLMTMPVFSGTTKERLEVLMITICLDACIVLGVLYI